VKGTRGVLCYSCKRTKAHIVRPSFHLISLISRLEIGETKGGPPRDLEYVMFPFAPRDPMERRNGDGILFLFLLATLPNRIWLYSTLYDIIESVSAYLHHVVYRLPALHFPIFAFYRTTSRFALLFLFLNRGAVPFLLSCKPEQGGWSWLQ